MSTNNLCLIKRWYNMTLEEVYQYYGSANKAAKALGLTRSAFSMWLKRGYIPLEQQRRYEQLSRGKLKIGDEQPQEQTGIFMPNFRFYSKVHGMCPVQSIHFRQGKAPKIIYFDPKNPYVVLSAFNSKTLMQATPLKDKKGKVLFEGDILEDEQGDRYVFDSIMQMREVKALQDFLITGNVFEKEN